MPLTESDIRARVGEASFERGRRYFLQGAVHTTRRLANTLRALCDGSQPRPYQVDVLLTSAGLASASCSCPVGAGGYCKHVAAVLLTWLKSPDEFVAVDPLETRLAAWSKEELIQLIGELLFREPALETTLERFAMRHTKTAPHVDPEAVRRQIERAYDDADYSDWRVSAHIAGDLQDIAAIGAGLLDRGEPAGAALVYRLIAEEVLRRYHEFNDEESELGSCVIDCVEELAQCLDALDAADEGAGAERGLILRALFDMLHWDVAHGGYGISDAIPSILLERTTDEERRQVAEWTFQSLPANDSDLRRYAREALGGLLLALQGGQLNDEQYLQICRDTGRQHDLIDRLLSLQRIDEVLAEVTPLSDYEVLVLSSVFEAQGQVDLFERLLRQRLPATRDDRLIAWLKQRALDRKDLGEALALQERLFWTRPSVEGYREMKSLAQPVHRWEEVEAGILNRLLQAKGYGMLIEIDLEEKDIDGALETWKLYEEERRSRGWGRPDILRLRLAQAAEERLPYEAIRLYTQEVDLLINMLGRDNYITAAGYLKRVRDICERLNEREAWQGYIASLRDNHRRQRALKEELDRAGL